MGDRTNSVDSEDVKYSMISEQLDLPSPLREYQWEGVSFFMRSESALLADEMGLGKTVQTAVALSLMLKEPQINRVLVVVPASLRLNWKREIGKWAPEIHCMIVTGNQKDRLAYYCLPIPILIASYEQIQIDVGMLYPCVRFDIVVLDEAQRIKNAGSSTSLACKLLPRDRSWALTGTPVENKPEDLVSIFSFVRRGLISKGLPLFEVHERISPFFLRRNKRKMKRLARLYSSDYHLYWREVVSSLNCSARVLRNWPMFFRKKKKSNRSRLF